MPNRSEGGVMKKAAAKKISDKAKKQAIEKKIKKALSTPQKASAKIKKVTAVTPKSKTKKTPVKKSKAASTKKPGAVTAKKKETTGKAIKKVAKKIVIKPEKARKKTTVKKEEQPAAKTEKRITVKPPVEKPVNKVRVTARKEIPAKKKPKKVVKKRAVKKIPAEKTKKVAVKKPAEKPKKDVATRVKPEKKEKQKKTRERLTGKAQRTAPAEEKKKEEKSVAPHAGPQITIREKLKKVLQGPPIFPEKGISYPPLPWETLPAEYGENAVTLMMVNPFKLFAFWEVKEDTLRIFKGTLTIRIYDVTGVDIEKSDPNSFFDIALEDRIGSLYVNVIPERVYIADIGIMYEGIFVGIARSSTVGTPRSTATEEGAVPICTETGEWVGY